MRARARMPNSMTNLRTWVTVISAISKVIRHMTTKLELSRHQDLKVTTTTVRSMDIEPLNVHPSLCGHQKNEQRQQVMDTSIIGKTTLGKAITTIKSVDTSLRIA